MPAAPVTAPVTAADLDPALPEGLRAEAAAWATATDAPTPADPARPGGVFRPDPAWLAAEAAFRAARPGLGGRADEKRLVLAFGDFRPGDLTHRRLCWLCVNACRTVRHCWDGIAENPDARDRLAGLSAHLRGEDRDDGGRFDLDGATVPAVPLRGGRPIVDCDVGRAGSVADAVAAAAKFVLTADPGDAAGCLGDVWLAVDEGCWWHDPKNPDSAPEEWAAWFVRHALPAAWRREELPPCDPGVPVGAVI